MESKKETFGPVEAMRRLLAGEKVRKIEWIEDAYIYLNKSEDIIYNCVGTPAYVTINLGDGRFEEYVEPREEFDFSEMARRAFADPDKVFGCDYFMYRVKSEHRHLFCVNYGKADRYLRVDRFIIYRKWHEVKE